jgi:hypothetical protein
MNPIFLDVECNVSRDLYMVGTLTDGEITQTITHPGLQLAAQAKGLNLGSPHDALMDIVELGKREGRPIVAYSQHDSGVIEHWTGVKPAAYVNALQVSKRWLWQADPAVKAVLRDKSLCSVYRAITGRRGPHAYARGHTTDRFNAVIDGLQKRGSYEQLTGTVKGKWTKVLAHNAFDLLAMAEMFQEMAARNPQVLEHLLLRELA